MCFGGGGGSNQKVTSDLRKPDSSTPATPGAKYKPYDPVTGTMANSRFGTDGVTLLSMTPREQRPEGENRNLNPWYTRSV